MSKKILFDMDGTLAMFYKRPDCLECMWEPGYFKYLEPYTNVLISAKILMERGYEVGVLSACVTDTAKKEKLYWLKYMFPELSTNILLCNVGENKAEVAKKAGFDMKNCILVDDYTKNCQEWTAGGGTAIKIINEINGKNGTWTGHRFNYEDIPENIVQTITDIAC